MKKLRRIACLLAVMLALIPISGMGQQVNVPPSPSSAPEKILLYGEDHGVDWILDKEFELWDSYYHDEGMRHLFIEYPYFTAEFLNLWIKSDNDDILDKLYRQLEGTQAHSDNVYEFFRRIKRECPETVFHGTDVGHQYNSTGKDYLTCLEQSGQRDSEQYILAEENMKQGEAYYSRSDEVYRENQMTENFIREYDKLGGAKIMGIYGSAHTDPMSLNYTGEAPSMAMQLREHYGELVFSKDILALKTPERVDLIQIGGKAYECSYFGKQDLSGQLGGKYEYREFWRVENAYEDLNGSPKTGDVLPYNNYPMGVELGQVLMIKYVFTDGAEKVQYYRSDGLFWQGMPATEEITLQN